MRRTGAGDGRPAAGSTPTVVQAARPRRRAAGRGHGGGGEAGEVDVGRDRAAGERGVPDPAGALRRRAADRGRRELEGAVGDAGVEVHAAVVVGGLDVVVHVGRPAGPCRAPGRRTPCRGAAMSRSARAWTPGRNSPAPISQSASVGGLAEQPLLEAGGEDVGDRLVERPGLALVDQPGGVLGDGVGELVAEHVDRLGEPVEDLAVAVAEDQLGAVPERVVVVAARSARSPTRRARAVVGVAAVDLARTAPATPVDAVGRLVDGDVARRPGRRPSAPGCRAASCCCRRCAPTHAGAGAPRLRRRPGRGRGGRAHGSARRWRRRPLQAPHGRRHPQARGRRRSARSRYGGTKGQVRMPSRQDTRTTAEPVRTAPGRAGSRRWRPGPSARG